MTRCNHINLVLCNTEGIKHINFTEMNFTIRCSDCNKNIFSISEYGRRIYNLSKYDNKIMDDGNNLEQVDFSDDERIFVRNQLIERKQVFEQDLKHWGEKQDVNEMRRCVNHLDMIDNICDRL